jgi:uncharacterized coiled-coil protein SlyX
VAGRLSSRLQAHLDCAQENQILIAKRYSEASKEIASKSEVIQKQNKIIADQERRLAEMVIPGLHCFTTESLIHELSCRGAASTVRIDCDNCGRILEKNKRIGALNSELSTVMQMNEGQRKEIAHLQSAVGKKRGKALRLGKKIAAQDAIIHGLNEKLRSLRAAVDGLKKTNADLRQTKGLVASMRAVCKDAEGHDLYIHEFSKEFAIAAGDGMNAKIDLDGLAQFVRSVVFEIKTRPTDAPNPKHDDTVDAMAYALWNSCHPNCRCWNGPIHDSAKSDEATEWIDRIFGHAVKDSE